MMTQDSDSSEPLDAGDPDQPEPDAGGPEPTGPDGGEPDPSDPDGMPMPEYDGPRKKGIAIHQRAFDWSEKSGGRKTILELLVGEQIEPIPAKRRRVRAHDMVWSVKR